MEKPDMQDTDCEFYVCNDCGSHDVGLNDDESFCHSCKSLNIIVE